MENIFKNLLVILGGLMIGFGIGLVVASSLTFGEAKYWTAIIGSLILGGFLMAVGLTSKEEKKGKEIKDDGEKEGPQKEEKPITGQEKKPDDNK